MLADLGRRLADDERVDIVACLPIEAAVRTLGCRLGRWSGPRYGWALMPCV
ncbi:hypothetical protein ACFRAI_07765 [Streptomyces sp. NPDC056637]|uniref:hypothetical protein n=1 Tax=unclassified Streptomyces TaxID=2593676 RepID=UPI0036CE5DEA